MTRIFSHRHIQAFLAALTVLVGVGPALAVKHVPFSVHSTTRDVPIIEFKDGQGRELRLADFKGRVVLLNVWATWCPPCRHEMPTLDRLQSMLGGNDFEVLALSIDRAGVNAVEAFFMETEVRYLKLYIDQSAAAMRKLAIVGVPTTLLIDREGREVWRHAGAAEWDNDEWLQEIRKAIGPSKE